MSLNPLLTEDPSSSFKVVSDLVRLRSRDRLEFIDITDEVAEAVQRSGVRSGVVNIQTRHTTTAIAINENEPLLLQDFRDLLTRWAPRHGRYRHDAFDLRTVNIAPGERPNGDSHARALVMRTSESLNLVEGQLQLGRWQRVFLVELDGGRMREVSIVVLGTAGRREGLPKRSDFSRVVA